MIDIYFKAATRAALVKKLIEAELLVDDFPAQGVSLDEIGEIEGVTGYHANVRLVANLTDEQIKALGNTIVATPETPYRVWA